MSDTAAGAGTPDPCVADRSATTNAITCSAMTTHARTITAVAPRGALSGGAGTGRYSCWDI
ncbi:hypothetical protein [Promicromonospora soli]|uniref:Uncharacterized protein n=1 Tax=Promicromonospora soli TaxID=2035533 RepID=A0A919FXS8_9MICO|nr:hypothetical protein [Promicromonospora soli]GHH74316.1 hypothetical protein GCM10017772_27700 [Promicromonospora soli]